MIRARLERQQGFNPTALRNDISWITRRLHVCKRATVNASVHHNRYGQDCYISEIN